MVSFSEKRDPTKLVLKLLFLTEISLLPKFWSKVVLLSSLFVGHGLLFEYFWQLNASCCKTTNLAQGQMYVSSKVWSVPLKNKGKQ